MREFLGRLFLAMALFFIAVPTLASVAQTTVGEPWAEAKTDAETQDADAVAEDASSTYANLKIETVLEGLNNPCGIAIQPETGDVFIADSGALRVIRVVDGKAENVITDFTKDTYGTGPSYDIGPLGLCFLNKETLVVGGGGKPDGEELIRLFKVPPKGEEPIKADKTFGDAKALLKADGTAGEGNFYGLVKGSRGVFVTCNGNDEKGWVSLVTFNDEKEINEFSRSIATKEATKVDAPVAITLSPDGYLTVGQMGEIDSNADSLLTFYSEEGDFLGKFETGLNDITALAFGPNQGRLFATDFKWSNTKEGGLYKLIGLGDDRKQGCKAELVAKLEKPTAMIFSETGVLYVLLSGDSEEGSGVPSGKLIKISGLDSGEGE